MLGCRHRALPARSSRPSQGEGVIGGGGVYRVNPLAFTASDPSDQRSDRPAIRQTDSDMKQHLRRHRRRESTFPRRTLLGWAAAGSGLFALPADGQVGTESPDHNEATWGAADRVGYGETKTSRWRIGMRVQSPVTCDNVIATFPIPMEWPEQSVTLVGQSVDPLLRQFAQRDLLGGVRQLLFRVPRITAGQAAEAIFDFEIARTQILAPEQTDDLRAPPRVTRELRPFMGNSPYIDATHIRIRNASKELATGEAENDWQRVEQIYDFVRERVRYTEGPIRDASEALRDGEGDCEEMTSLFVALCRNARIPARMVWIPDHCYPEFLLHDEAGNAHWFPCQAAGTRQFGRMEEERPVLQKGDRFKPPESRSPVRYVSETFSCDKRGKRDPRIEFIREPIID